MPYYDGTKLLSLSDINGNKPEIYICTTNRTGGKSTYFGRLLLNRFVRDDSKFILLYRFNYELDECADKFFKDIGSLFFPGHTMTSKARSHRIYHDLYFDDKHCGYALTLNSADSIKKMSHLFTDADRILFDEFQSETNHYCPDEVSKFQSIHTSVARGQNKQTRYVPVYMIGNPVTMINPYYVALGISDRLNENTKFLRGNGFVLEQGYVKSAAEAMSESAFNKAFSADDYQAYAGQGIYLNDSKAFIDSPAGISRYIATIRYNGKNYGVREYANDGIIYCSDKSDDTFPVRLAVTTDDHNINYVMLRQNKFTIELFRYYFDRGVFRFKNLQCKSAIMHAISY